VNILIVGKSALGNELLKLCSDHTTTIVGKPEFDLSTKKDCNRLINDFSPDCVILTHGTMCEDSWEQLTTNSTSTIYLIEGFFRKMVTGQIICVSSASVNWQSWPGISFKRMTYAVSKEAVSNYCAHLNRKNIPNDSTSVPISIQVYEPNSFKSKMNNSTLPVSVPAKELRYLIDNPRVSLLRGLNR